MKNSYKIVVVAFPFIEKPKLIKKRPVLVLTSPTGKHKLIIVSSITTNTKEVLVSDILLEKNKDYFPKTGLIYDSKIELHKLFTVGLDQIEGEIGLLSQEKNQEVQNKLRQFFQI